jgi:Ca2+-binding EF-hand superfamily protein
MQAMRTALLTMILFQAGSASRFQRRILQPVHDGLGDELVDQADPEFRAVAKGDDCISPEDFKDFIAGHNPLPPREAFLDDAEYEDFLADVKNQMSMMYDYADSKGGQNAPDGCVNKEEFDFVNDMEGPPQGEEYTEYAAEDPMNGEYDEKMELEPSKECGEPLVMAPPDFPPFAVCDRNDDKSVSFQELDETARNDPNQPPPQFVVDAIKEMADKDKSKSISLDEYCGLLRTMETEEGQMKLQELVGKHMGEMQTDTQAHECMALDANGDDRISQDEAWDFVSDMEGTDFNHVKMQSVWDAADTDKDGFISYAECREAGKNYAGDGKEGPGVGKEDLKKKFLFISKNQTTSSVHTKKQAKLSQKQKAYRQKHPFLSLWVNPKVMHQWRPESVWLTQTRNTPVHAPSMHTFLHHFRIRQLRAKYKAKHAKKA